MSNASTLKDFLVSLGFKVDKGGQRQFIDSIGEATMKAVALGAAVTATATAIVAGVSKIADNFEQLYFASQRTNSAVDNMQAMGFAAVNMGSSAESAMGSLENLARFLRNSPGAEGLLKNIGIQTREANGAMRDTTTLIDDLGKTLAVMPYYKANAYAQALGIDEKTLMVMRQGMNEFGNEYKRMLHQAGVDSGQAAEDSHEFMVQLRLLGASFSILSQKIASMMTGKLAHTIANFRVMFTNNFDRISAVIVKVMGFVLNITDAISTLALRGINAIAHLVDWFSSLSDGSKTIITVFGALAVAWGVLSAGFLATPLGRIVLLMTTIAALWDDYQVWKEGGKTLIDWSAWAPGIEAAIKGISAIGGWIHKALEFTGDWRPLLEILLSYVAGSWVFGMLAAAAKVSLGFGGITTALTTVMGGMLANAGLLAAAGALGYGLGTIIHDKFIQGTDFGNAIGRTVAKALSFFGNKEATEALKREQPGTNIAVHPEETKGNPTDNRVWGTQRGLRNNNPGNLNYVGQAGATKESGSNGRFAVFGTAQAGLDALANQLRIYNARGISTISAIIKKYAPENENNTAAYIDSVSKKLGIGASDKINFKDPKQMTGMMDAIIRVENSKNPYTTEMLAKAASSAGAIDTKTAGNNVALNQTTNITVTGSNDSKALTADIVTAQNNVNQNLVRNTRGAILQ